ncbi:MAG TPA: metal-sulfur cluster assembly factor [Balneolaceae bacterium]|nr:metal-sulfur cluster assembly factor [Balneolaceae bacterium]
MPKIKEIERAPNPNGMQFFLDIKLTDGKKYLYNSVEEARDNDVVASILAIKHITNVEVWEQSIIVIQDGKVDWAPILGQVAPFIREAQPIDKTALGLDSSLETTKVPTVNRNAIVRELRTVIDPELGINIVDLGLVYNIIQNDNKVTVEFTATTPGCPMRRYLQQHIEGALERLDITNYEVKLVWEPTWSIDMMNPEVDLFSSQKSQRWIL